MSDKSEIRKHVKTVLKNLSPYKKFTFSGRIQAAAINIKQFKKARSIMIFMALGDEPQTDKIISAALSKGKKVYIPKVDGDDLLVTELAPDTVFEKNKWDIAEGGALTDKRDFDLIFVPLVAFDGNLNRMGRGKGYYDRFLKQAKGVKVGLAFCCQRADELPVEEHDVPLDIIVTEQYTIGRLNENNIG